MAQDEFIFPPTFLSFLWRLFKSLHHFANIQGSGSATTKHNDFHLHRLEHVLVFLMQLMFISKILQLSFCSAYRVEASYSLQTSSSGEELYIVFHHGSVKGLYFRIRTVWENCNYRTRNNALRYYRTPNIDFAKTTLETLALCYTWHLIFLITFLN